MWVLTTEGFFSAVEDKRDPDTIVVRARVHGDAAALCKRLGRSKGAIITNEGTDYPYRVRCSRAEWTRAVAAMAVDVDYTNFKDAVKARQGKARASAYSRIWSVLYGLTPARVRDRHERRWRRGRDLEAPLFTGEYVGEQLPAVDDPWPADDPLRP